MKLSEIKGERALDALADLIEPVADIAADEEAMKLFSRSTKGKDESNRSYTLRRIKQHLPYLIKTHKHELVQIFAALDGADPDDYAASLSILTLPVRLLELLNDRALIELFSSAASTAAESSAASAPAIELRPQGCSSDSAPTACNETPKTEPIEAT